MPAAPFALSAALLAAAFAPPAGDEPADLAPGLAPAPTAAEAAGASGDGPADDPAAPDDLLRRRGPAGDAMVEATARFLAGQALLRGGDPDAAFEEFSAARGSDPDSVEILRSLVAVAFEIGREGDGQRFAAELSDRDPTDWKLALTLGRLKLRGNDPAAAQVYMKRAATSPDLPTAGPEAAEALRGYAVLSAGLNRFADAAEGYEKLIPLLAGDEGGLDFRTRTALLSDRRTAPVTAGQVLAAAGRHLAAAAAYRLALSLDADEPGGVAGGPDEPAARAQLAAVLTAGGEPGAALEELNRLMSGEPGGPSDPAPVVTPATLVLQKALTDLDRADEIVGRLAAWRDRFPDDLTLAVNLATARANAGQLEKAETDLTGLAERYSESPVWAPLATVRRMRKDAAGWIDAVARAKALDLTEADDEPRRAAEAEDFRDAVLGAVPAVDPTPADADGSEIARAKEVIRAQLAAAAGRADEVEAGLRSALGRDRARRFDVLLTLISVLNDAGAQDRAAAITDEALADDGLDDPDLGGRRAEFLVVRAQLHRNAGETDAALGKLAAAEATNPANPFFAFQTAVTKLGAGDDDGAAAELRRVLDLSAALENGGGDLEKDSRLLLSSLLTRRGDAEEGEALLVEQLEQTPDDPTVNNDLGYLWADRGENLERAEAMIRKAVAAEPENPAFLDSLGWVLLKRGRPEEAQAPLEEAARRTKNGDGTIWSHLGDLWDALGERQQAIDAWRSALQRANTSDAPDERLIESLKQKLGR